VVSCNTVVPCKCLLDDADSEFFDSNDDTGCSGSSSCEVDIGQLALDDGQLCPAELEQALQGDSLLLMACSAGYYQLAQVLCLLLSYASGCHIMLASCKSLVCNV